MAFTPVKFGSLLTASDAAAGDAFGISTAMSADGLFMVVGASNWEGANADQGTVYSYDWNDTTKQWDATGWTSLTTADAAASDQFGLSLSLSADGLILVASAYLAEDTGTLNTGQVYTFYRASRTTKSWTVATTAAYLADPATRVTNDGFGVGVAISGDGLLLAVGAFQRDATYTDQGTAYVYTRSGSAPNYVWTLRDTLVAADAAASDFYGRNVALNSTGTVLAVSASQWEGSSVDQGGVYIYDWNSGSSTWMQRGSVVVDPSNQASSHFGESLSISSDGTKLLVSGSGYDATYADQGAVWLFEWSGGTWVCRNNLPILYDAPATTQNLYGTAINGAASLAALGIINLGVGGSVQMYELDSGARPGAFGAITSSHITLSGVGGTPRSLTGDITLPAVTTTGGGSPALIVTASLTTPSVTLTATAYFGVQGTGVLEVPAVSCTGAGGFYGGAITLPTITATGALQIGLVATGDIALPKVTSAGTARVTIIATGSIHLPKVIAASTGLLGDIGSGALRLPHIRMTGTAARGVAGYGQITLPVVTLEAHMFQTLLGQGASRVGKVTSQGMVQ